MSYKSYYLYREEQKIGDQEWTATGYMSVDGDGTMPMVTKSDTDENCGYVVPTSSDYLTFTALENGTFQFTTNSIQYSLDDGATWTTIAASTNTPTVNSGNTIMFKQVGLTPTSNAGIGTFKSSGRFTVSGNPLSLVYGDNFSTVTELSTSYQFTKLFSGCTKLVSAENLTLQATKLSRSCYASMFINCTSLTLPPELPAMNLAGYCYSNMFDGCTSLTRVPNLPATTVPTYAYWYMFDGCSSLTSAPNLPGTDVGDHAYQLMFNNCTNITTGGSISVKHALASCCASMFQGCTKLRGIGNFELETTASRCCMSMFQGCTSLVYAPIQSSTSAVSEYCFSRMFQGCTSLQYSTTFLLATQLAPNCYEYMFAGCTSLTEAPNIFASKMSNQCCRYMFSGCTSLQRGASVPSYSESDLATECFAYMYYGCSSLNYLSLNVVDMSTDTYLTNWVHGVSSTGTFKKNSGATWNYVGDSGVPTGWTITT